MTHDDSPTPADFEALLQVWTDAMTAIGAAPGDDRVAALGRDLLARWGEPHRDYHGISHLVAGLDVLGAFEARPVEIVAWWFHDAVHHNDSPWDEQKSADLARSALPGLVAPDYLNEVPRLVLLTINHDPAADDSAGQRVCDADLAMIAADRPAYLRTLAALRRERTTLNDIEWDALRINTTGRLLNREWLFHTPHARTEWEQPARRNLTAERQALFTPEEPTT